MRLRYLCLVLTWLVATPAWAAGFEDPYGPEESASWGVDLATGIGRTWGSGGILVRHEDVIADFAWWTQRAGVLWLDTIRFDQTAVADVAVGLRVFFTSYHRGPFLLTELGWIQGIGPRFRGSAKATVGTGVRIRDLSAEVQFAISDGDNLALGALGWTF